MSAKPQVEQRHTRVTITGTVMAQEVVAEPNREASGIVRVTLALTFGPYAVNVPQEVAGEFVCGRDVTVTIVPGGE